jgi:phosphatidylserine decarboxylase
MKFCGLHTPFCAVAAFYIFNGAFAWIPHLPTTTRATHQHHTTSLKSSFYQSCEDDEIPTPTPPVAFRPKARVGNWLPTNVEDLDTFLGQVTNAALSAKEDQDPLIKPIEDMRDIVLEDAVLRDNVETMFTDAKHRQLRTPLKTPAIEDFEHFLHILNTIVQTAPAFYTTSATTNTAAGLIAFPINAVLDFPMSTEAGYAVFSNSLINQQFRKILNHWSIFLESEKSAYVLNGTQNNALNAPLIPWLSEEAESQVVNVAFQYTKETAPEGTKFEDVFITVPNAPNLGYTSWDEFFTKEFKEGVRPIGGPAPGPIWLDSDRVILNACESAPLALSKCVQLDDAFWVKEQPYSIRNILDFDERASQFAGGTVYQAFLSGLSYHRWHSPVSGTIAKTSVVGGSYFLENVKEGFDNPAGADTVAPNASQKFLTAVATRGLIFIEADGPIGLMCFVAVGMSEVSSCDITVEAGQRVEKGDEIGMFHYGGSSHCLLFRDNVNLDFCEVESFYNTGKFGVNATNVPVRAQLARVMDNSPALRDV